MQSNKITNIAHKIQNNPLVVKWMLVVFYAVGILGIFNPFLYEVFKNIIPFVLLMSFAVLFLFHDFKTKFHGIWVFLFIYIVGLIVEVVGVQSGVIFGGYIYGNNLGFKVFETPLIIGLNWLFLSYLSASVLERFKFNMSIKIVLASVIMLVYDIILEQVAPSLGMWYWVDDKIPLQNYFAWFIISLIFQTILKVSKIKTANPISFTLLVCQILFFLSVNLLNQSNSL